MPNWNYPRRGESHHRARLSDADVELIRQLHESTSLGYESISRKFGCGASTVRDIVKYRTRQAPQHKDQ